MSGVEIGIGSTLWLFDTSRRRYRPGESRPIYREHFYPVTVVAENKTSWLCGPHGQTKVNKKTMQTKGGFGLDPHVFASEAEIDDACWVNNKRHAVERAVSQCRDADVLRQIAAILKVTP